MEYKMALLLRGDLEISCGKAVAQGAHAAVEAYRLARKEKPGWARAWISGGQRKVVLKARDLEEMLVLFEKAMKEGIPAVLIKDAGLTEIPPDTPTAVGIGPAPEHVLDNITGSLPLYRG